MPYVITTLHPWADANAPARRARTRTAVATLEEARKAATDALAERTPAPANGQPDQWDAALATVDATGGTIGPLPDGTVIEVRRVTLDELADLAGWAEPADQFVDEDDALRLQLEAFNAA